MKLLLILVLKGYPCVGVSLYSLCMPSVFGGKSGFELSMSDIFPQCVVAAIILVGGGIGDEGSRDRARCEPGLLFCSVANITLLRAGPGPKLLKQKP